MVITHLADAYLQKKKVDAAIKHIEILSGTSDITERRKLRPQINLKALREAILNKSLYSERVKAFSANFFPVYSICCVQKNIE